MFRLACLLKRHRPIPGQFVRRGPVAFSRCQRCGAPIRSAGSGKWTRDCSADRRRLLGRIACLLNRHRPRDNAARWDGSHFVSRCDRCGERIRRIKRSTWLLD